jgi:uncharacterized protein involved in exopolysaccharide biosynthesis
MATKPELTRLESARNYETYSELNAAYDEIEFGAWLSWFSLHWRLLVVFLLCGMIASIVLSQLTLTKWYRAEAIIRPVSRSSIQNRLSSVGALPISGIGSLFSAANSSEAEEDMTILKSYAFQLALAERHDLKQDLLRTHLPAWVSLILPAPGNDVRRIKWREYKALQKRFSCEYRTKTENITIYFLGRDPHQAEATLGYFIDDLREKLRKQEIDRTSAALDSLNQQVATISDAMLQQRLYELVAKQIQERTLAKVQADFAFTVLEPPISSYKPYAPDPLIYGFAGGALGLLVGILIASRRDRFSNRQI